MNKEKDYNPDSDDQSDEDYNPFDKANESLSEEETDEDVGDDCQLDSKPSNKKKKSAPAKLRKSQPKQDIEEVEDATQTRQSDTNGVGNGKHSLEKNDLDSDEEQDKSRTDALWADFLSDVKTVAPKNTVSKAEKEKQPNSEIEEKNKQTEPIVKEETKKVTVTEVVDFAGEEVMVQKTISADSIKENKTAATTTSKTTASPRSGGFPAGLKRSASGAGGGGLGSLLNQLGKKKKISVLDKSKMDWNSFKQDEGIDEQLQTFNKGKDGYLERQDFLQRTDLRQFEIEKNLRQTSRRPL